MWIAKGKSILKQLADFVGGKVQWK
jgi:hypothetical protein